MVSLCSFLEATSVSSIMLDSLLTSTLSRYTLLAILLFTTYIIANHVLDSLRIRRYGARAPQISGWLPLNTDIVLDSMKNSREHTDLKFWTWLFSHSKSNSPTVECPLGGQRFIFTAQPENIKAILATQFGDYGKGEPFHEDWKEFLGESIFTTDGDLWHGSRQLIRPQFVKSRVSDLELFETHVQKLIGLLGGKGQEVDVDALFYRYTLDIAMDFLLGHSVDSLGNPHNEFAEAFGEVQRVQSHIARVGPFNRFISRKSFRKGLRVMEDFVQPIITQCLLLNPGTLKDVESQSFLHALANATRDRKVIRDQIVAVLLAGRDTTAGTLSFLFHELSQHPKVVQRLRQEIMNKVGSHRAPTYEDLKDMGYLQHCMSETMRLYPAVPFNVRLALKDTTLPTGGGPNGDQPIGVLKNTPIGYSVLFMQRRPDLYPAPSEDFASMDIFSPERWEVWQPKSWNYIPFNGGPRICIGQQFALTEMTYTVVRILQRFERVERYWKLDGGSLFKSEIVISPRQPVKVGFFEA